MGKEAVLFDFDGVVVNTEPLYERAERKLFEEYGINISEDEWKLFKGISENAFYNYIKRRFNIKDPVDVLKKKGRDYLKQEFLDHIDYVDGFLQFYNSIRKKYRTALVTSTSGSVLKWIFENTKIENMFDIIITSHDVRNTKPHPEPYIKACLKLSVKPDKVVAIEDTIVGIKSAISAGIDTIGLTTTFSRDEIKEVTRYIANNYGEVKYILDKLEGENVICQNKKTGLDY